MTTTTSNNLSNTSLKQPKGLSILFFVELWERFGFYAVQSLLVLFLSKEYHYSDTQAYDLFTAYSALIYATPVIGGYIADKLLGFRRAILLGGVLYVIGYFILASTSHSLFYLALSFLICGNGFFKSCVSSLLGTLYLENDPRRDSGFTIFYMGINLGGLVSPIICTWVANNYGWGYGFAVAGCGVVIGLIIAISGFKRLGTHGLPPDPKRLTRNILPGLSIQTLVYITALIAILLISWLIQYSRLVDHALDLFSAFVLIAVIMLIFRHGREQRNKMLVLITLVIFSIFFWVLWAQMFSSFVLFIDRVINRHILYWTIPTGMFISFEPIFIILLSPLLATLWIHLGNTRWNPSTPAKFALGLIFLGIGFLLPAVGISFAGNSGIVHYGWMISCYLLITIGELLLSPTGLAMITALAPRNRVGMMMGVWFLSTSMAFAIADYVADLTNIPKEVTDVRLIGPIYGHVFSHFGLIALVIGLVLWILTPRLKHLLES